MHAHQRAAVNLPCTTRSSNAHQVGGAGALAVAGGGGAATAADLGSGGLLGSQQRQAHHQRHVQLVEAVVGGVQGKDVLEAESRGREERGRHSEAKLSLG